MEYKRIKTQLNTLENKIKNLDELELHEEYCHKIIIEISNIKFEIPFDAVAYNEITFAIEMILKEMGEWNE